MKKHFLVAGIGEFLWDMLPSGKKPGGAPFNFAWHAGLMGCESHIISAIGKDEAGLELKELMLASGLSARHLQENDFPTSTVSVVLDQYGQPEYTIHENVAWDHLEWNHELSELAVQLDAVCFGSLAQRSPGSEQSIQTFLGALSPGCLKVFDINIRQTYFTRELIDRSLRNADVLKLNEQELPVISGFLNISTRVGEQDQLDLILREYPLKYIIYTMGARGSLIMRSGETSFQVPPSIKVVDTVGAGDAFTAAFISGILRGLPLKEVHKRANEISAWVCTQEGATPEHLSGSFLL